MCGIGVSGAKNFGVQRFRTWPIGGLPFRLTGLRRAPG
jgi:hypothetical protein